MLRQGAGCAGYATDQHLAAILCRSGAGGVFSRQDGPVMAGLAAIFAAFYRD
jgi:hypothetical protein